MKHTPDSGSQEGAKPRDGGITVTDGDAATPTKRGCCGGSSGEKS